MGYFDPKPFVKVDATEAMTQDLDAHKEESMSRRIFSSRDMSLVGVQEISMPFKAKSMICISYGGNEKSESTGVWSETGQQTVRSRRGSDDSYIASSNLIRLYDDISNYINGSVQNVTSTGFEINWTKTGSPTGTSSFIILVSSHGGE